MKPGDPVLLRSIHRGQVRFAIPQHFVGEDTGRMVFCRLPGSQGMRVARDANGKYLDRWIRGDPATPFTWTRSYMLLMVRLGDAHSLELFWDEQHRFLGWYVNLQAPIRRSPLGFDTMDQALDVWVDPDGRWRWKDEDDFAEARTLGILDNASAAAIRTEGERVIADRPWPTGWESWRPPPAWKALPLPSGWNVVERDGDVLRP